MTSGPCGRRRGRALHSNCDAGQSFVVHYQEIALKGKNRPWFLAQLVAQPAARAVCRPRRARACARSWAASRSCLRPAVAPPTMSPTASATPSASPTSRWRGRVPIDLDGIAARGAAATWATARARLPRVGTPRRQALPAVVAADRARGRRPHQGGQGMARRSRASRRSTIRLELLSNEAFYFFDKQPGPAGCRSAPRGAWCACSRAASTRRWRRTG